MTESMGAGLSSWSTRCITWRLPKRAPLSFGSLVTKSPRCAIRPMTHPGVIILSRGRGYCCCLLGWIPSAASHEEIATGKFVYTSRSLSSYPPWSAVCAKESKPSAAIMLTFLIPVLQVSINRQWSLCTFGMFRVVGFGKDDESVS